MIHEISTSNSCRGSISKRWERVSFDSVDTFTQILDEKAICGGSFKGSLRRASEIDKVSVLTFDIDNEVYKGNGDSEGLTPAEAQVVLDYFETITREEFGEAFAAAMRPSQSAPLIAGLPVSALEDFSSLDSVKVGWHLLVLLPSPFSLADAGLIQEALWARLNSFMAERFGQHLDSNTKDVGTRILFSGIPLWLKSGSRNFRLASDAVKDWLKVQRVKAIMEGRLDNGGLKVREVRLDAPKREPSTKGRRMRSEGLEVDVAWGGFRGFYKATQANVGALAGKLAEHVRVTGKGLPYGHWYRFMQGAFNDGLLSLEDGQELWDFYADDSAEAVRAIYNSRDGRQGEAKVGFATCLAIARHHIGEDWMVEHLEYVKSEGVAKRKRYADTQVMYDWALINVDARDGFVNILQALSRRFGDVGYTDAQFTFVAETIVDGSAREQEEFEKGRGGIHAGLRDALADLEEGDTFRVKGLIEGYSTTALNTFLDEVGFERVKIRGVNLMRATARGLSNLRAIQRYEVVWVGSGRNLADYEEIIKDGPSKAGMDSVSFQELFEALSNNLSSFPSSIGATEKFPPNLKDEDGDDVYDKVLQEIMDSERVSGVG